MNKEKIKELKKKIRQCAVVDWRFNNENNVLAALVMVDALAELDTPTCETCGYALDKFRTDGRCPNCGEEQPNCQKDKAGDAARECRNIECHIEQFFSEEDLEKWGANKIDDHERELHFRVMRIFANVNNQLSDQQKKIERLKAFKNICNAVAEFNSNNSSGFTIRNDIMIKLRALLKESEK
jgi:predicted Zn-ribbon and HTH transcriptional regulator